MGSGAWALGLFVSQFLGPHAHPLVWYFFSLVLFVSLVVMSFVVISFVVLSANNSNVNMQHIKRDQPKATRMHVRATRASRAFAVRVHARCACSGPTDSQPMVSDTSTPSLHARVAM